MPGNVSGMKRLRSWMVVACLFLPWAPVRGEDDPAAKWLTIYGWIQTADRLAGAGQWPLALGSYLEADRQIRALAAAHPGFEPKMIAYRSEALAATIAGTEARLTTDEHEVMMKYLDFIESLELGEAQRYANEYEAAYATLGMAMALLEEIIGNKPAEFREAVASQHARLESSLTWLDSQINFTAMTRPGVVVGDDIDWGTTRFIKAGDLPSGQEGVPVTAALFPGIPASAAREPLGDAATGETAVVETEEDSPAEPDKPGGPARFRMSSRQSEAPARP